MFLIQRFSNTTFSKLKITKPFTNYRQKNDKIFYNINDAIDFVYNSIKLMKGGEIFIPKINSILIRYSKALNSNYKIVGIKMEKKFMKH